MEVLIFQTDIKSKKKVNYFKPIFKDHSGILNWTIDLEDIDNVLRIETTTNLTEDEVIGLVSSHGFYINPLTD